MEKNYNIINYDYHNFYYFIDEYGCFQVPKNISIDQYENLCMNYFQKTNSWISSFLFDGGEFKKKSDILKFLIIDLETVDLLIKPKILELFKELIYDVEFLELKGKTVGFYFNHLDLSFKDIINTINNDFYSEIKVYESGRLNLNKPQDFQSLFELYIKYADPSRVYTSNSNLIIDIINKETKKMKILKSIILHKLLQDSQFTKLTESLFENNLNVTKTASDVFMHRNTINNKIDLIKKETGLNIQNFYDALAMYMLLNVK